jgi:hypothetical protein
MTPCLLKTCKPINPKPKNQGLPDATTRFLQKDVSKNFDFASDVTTSLEL